MKRTVARRRASALLLVLIVVPILTLGAYSFTHWMEAEGRGAAAHIEMTQARWLVHSGIEYVRALLSNPAVFEPGAIDLWDNPSAFARVRVVENFRGREGAFSIVAPILESRSREIRYGLENESGKIPLHRRRMLLEGDQEDQRERLMQLPNMTVDVADAILDWIDRDDDPREGGAEADYYLGLANPYSPRNAPPRTIGELLLVRGVTPWLLYGEDANLNGVLDPNENDGDKSWPPDNADGVLDRGWSPYFTVHSAASNLDPEGNPKINLNEDLSAYEEELVELFGQEWFDFVQAYKSGRGRRRIRAVSELIDAEARPQRNRGNNRGNRAGSFDFRRGEGGRNQREPEPIPSPWTSGGASQYLDDALQYLTVEASNSDAGVVRGRIDVSQAPVEVLLTLPGLSIQSAEAVAAAGGRGAADLSPAWIFTEGLVTLEEFRRIEPYITTQGRVFRVESVGFLSPDGPVVRVEAIIDASSSPARVRSRRELVNLPAGYPQSALAEGATYLPESADP